MKKTTVFLAVLAFVFWTGTAFAFDYRGGAYGYLSSDTELGASFKGFAGERIAAVFRIASGMMKLSCAVYLYGDAEPVLITTFRKTVPKNKVVASFFTLKEDSETGYLCLCEKLSGKSEYLSIYISTD